MKLHVLEDWFDLQDLLSELRRDSIPHEVKELEGRIKLLEDTIECNSQSTNPDKTC